LRPGQPGTLKLVERYGERLIRVRYVYDPGTGRRLKTVELVVESVPWTPRRRKQRRQDDDIVYARGWGSRIGLWKAGDEAASIGRYMPAYGHIHK
jgi:hypothetical protein